MLSNISKTRKTPEQPFYYVWTNFTLVFEDLNDGTGATYGNSSD